MQRYVFTAKIVDLDDANVGHVRTYTAVVNDDMPLKDIINIIAPHGLDIKNRSFKFIDQLTITPAIEG
jgi:hypothetical protein